MKQNLNGTGEPPANDGERVAALERYQIVDTVRETAFNSICELACELFACPVSHISFLDTDTEYIKASVGLEGVTKLDRGVGFCALAILQPEVMLIEDTHDHPVLSHHPYVTDNLRIRFYAAAPVITPDGYIIGTMCIIDTQPRTLTGKEQQLLQKLAKVVMEQTELRYNNLSLLQQRDDFIAMAAHEMRTPLTPLRAAVEFLYRKREDYPQTQCFIEQANRSVTKLTHLANDLFDASQLKIKKFTLETHEFDLHNLITLCCDQMKITGKFNCHLMGDTYIRLVADEPKIEQVLINLFENAVKYAPASEEITIDVKRQPGAVRISVADEGPGIAPEKLPHIFRRYFRSEPGSAQTGLGLGLYICAEIVKRHGGDIGVDSTPGAGSTFWFTLPLTVPSHRISSNSN